MYFKKELMGSYEYLNIETNNISSLSYENYIDKIEILSVSIFKI